MSITDSLNYTYTNSSRFTINYTYSKLNYCSLASMNWSVISSNALDSSALCLAASIVVNLWERNAGIGNGCSQMEALFIGKEVPSSYLLEEFTIFMFPTNHHWSTVAVAP